MKTMTTREELKIMLAATKEVIKANNDLATRLDKAGDETQANLIRIITDSVRSDHDALRMIIDIAGYLEESAKDLEWYTTRREPRNFETQIEGLNEYRADAQTRLAKRIAFWNRTHTKTQIEL